MKFEWDSRKDSQNQKKHGISFEEASSVFFDDMAKVAMDPDHSDEEDRFIIVGLSSTQRLLLVVHCYRDKDEVIRIISARKLTRKEKRMFEERS